MKITDPTYVGRYVGDGRTGMAEEVVADGTDPVVDVGVVGWEVDVVVMAAVAMNDYTFTCVREEARLSGCW